MTQTTQQIQKKKLKTIDTFQSSSNLKDSKGRNHNLQADKFKTKHS